MSVDALLSRLDGVKRTGPGRWIARCSAHDDRHASLSVRELDDGRVLVHDFAGCSVEEVLAAVGMTFDAPADAQPGFENASNEGCKSKFLGLAQSVNRSASPRPRKLRHERRN